MKPVWVLLIASLYFLPATHRQVVAEPAAKPSIISENPHKAVIQHSIEVLNQGDTSAVAQAIAPDYKYYSPSNAATPLSRQEMMAQLKSVLAAFPDLRWQIKAMYAAEDWVITRFVISGTQQGDYMGIPANGRKIEYSSIVICHFKDGKIIEEREELNLLGIMQQLNLELKPKEN